MTMNNVEQWLSAEFDEFVCSCIPNEHRARFIQSAYITGNAVIRDLVNDRRPETVYFFLADDGLAKLLSSIGHALPNFNDKPCCCSFSFLDGRYRLVTEVTGNPETLVARAAFMQDLFFFRDGRVIELAPNYYLKYEWLEYNYKRTGDIGIALLLLPDLLTRGMRIVEYDFSLILRDFRDHPRDKHDYLKLIKKEYDSGEDNWYDTRIAQYWQWPDEQSTCQAAAPQASVPMAPPQLCPAPAQFNLPF